VAVVERGEVVLAEAYGLADIGAGRPATPDTAYLLASATKPITATAICIAADEGLLELDARVPGDYRWPAPTARQLLRHRGGFGAHYDFHYGGGERPIDADRYALLYREPGAGFEYANLGYRILGRMVEAAAGQELGEFVRERVFEPLGLADCHLGASYPGPAPSAARYTVDGRAYPMCDTSTPRGHSRLGDRRPAGSVRAVAHAPAEAADSGRDARRPADQRPPRLWTRLVRVARAAGQ